MRPQLFKLSQRPGQHDLANGAGDGLADPCIPGQIRIVPDEFSEAFGQSPDLDSRALIRFYLVGVFFLGREQLSEAGQPVGNLGVALNQWGRRD